MITYIEDGKGRHDIRFVPQGYEAQANETVVEGDRIEDIQAYRMVSYAEMRAKEYPPMADYLDAVVKGDAESQQDYVEVCLAVKTKYPKNQTYRVEG